MLIIWKYIIYTELKRYLSNVRTKTEGEISSSSNKLLTVSEVNINMESVNKT